MSRDKFRSKFVVWWGLGLLIALFAIVSRLGYLNWGAPWYFHPDERNVAMAVSRIYSKIEGGDSDAYNPEFFAYGGLPIYSILGVTKLVMSLGKESWDPFVVAILVSRVFSGIFMLVIPLLSYKIGLFWGKKVGIVTLISSVFCLAYMQFARYGTFESWLTLSYLIILWLSIEIVKKWRISIWWGLCVMIGVAMAIKVPSLVLVGLGGWVWFYRTFKLAHKAKSWGVKTLAIINMVIIAVMGGILGIVIFIATNPYAFDEQVGKQNPIVFVTDVLGRIGEVLFIPSSWNEKGIGEIFGREFLHSINVEGGIARGEIEVFYTRHFSGSSGGWYQMIMIMPWLVSVPGVILALVGFVWVVGMALRKHHPSLLLIIWLGSQLVFTFSLYVKWTRYMVPVVPGFLLIASLAGVRMWGLINNLWAGRKNLWKRRLLLGGMKFAAGWHILYSVMFLVMMNQPDSRIEAADWSGVMINPDAKVLSEVYDLGILPFNQALGSEDISLFNFYDLDNGNATNEDLERKLEDTDVIIVLSRRIWKHSLDNREKFPNAAEFYSQLFNSEKGFIKVQEFSNYPRFGPLIVYDEIRAEETFSVFDHPRVQIWVRQSKYDQIMIK